MTSIDARFDPIAIAELTAALAAAGGSESAVDNAIADLTGFGVEPYTGSVDSARSLAERLLPETRVHLGYGVTGVFPVATIMDGDQMIAREAPTVPLAILRAVMARLHEGQSRRDTWS